VFELVIVLLEGGAGTTYLFNEINVGSELILRGPQGVFVLPEQIDRDVFLICTGTGVAPFRSMAHHLVNHGISHQEIFLIFGCRKFHDCLYGKELKALEEKDPNFHYIPTFSREEPKDPLIKTGYVHKIYEEICREATISNNGDGKALKPAYFYLCGWKNMIDEAKQRILSMGYDKKSIRQELYG
jgi:ferredoxin-NADP reductase